MQNVNFEQFFFFALIILAHGFSYIYISKQKNKVKYTNFLNQVKF